MQSHRSALGHRAGRERWRVEVEGKWEVPYTAIMASFINDMPLSFVPS